MALLINIKSVVKQVVPERGSGSPVGPAEGVGGGAARGTRGVPKPPGAPKHLPGQLGQSPAPGSPRYLLGDRAHAAHMDGGMLPIRGSWTPSSPQPSAAPLSPPGSSCRYLRRDGVSPRSPRPGQAALSTGAGRQTAGGGRAQGAGGLSGAPVLGVPGRAAELGVPHAGPGSPYL